MQFLSYLLIPLAVGVVITVMNNGAVKAEKSMDENHFVVRQPKIAIWIGIVVMLFFGALTVIMSIFPNDTAEWWVYLLFILFVLMGAFLAVYCALWKLEVNQNEISYTAPMRRTETFTFDVINKARIKHQNTPNESVAVYSQSKKLLSIELNCPGYNVFISRLNQAGIKFE